MAPTARLRMPAPSSTARPSSAARSAASMPTIASPGPILALSWRLPAIWCIPGRPEPTSVTSCSASSECDGLHIRTRHADVIECAGRSKPGSGSRRMTVKLLLIEDEAVFRRHLRHHITTEWADAANTEHDPSTDGKLAPELTAAGYEAVILDQQVAGGSGLEWLTDLSARPGFPPIIFLTPSAEDAVVLPALRAGAEVCISKVKIDHRRFIGAVREATRKRKRQLTLLRGSAQAQQAYRFGNVTIRGQRYVRTIATGAISTVYLAESERVGALVVLKVLSQVPDVAEGKGTFERFLQEYEVVAKVEHPNVVRIYDLGVADDHAYIAMEYFAAGDLRARMRQKVTPSQALVYLRQMAAALQAIHGVGVLHRDLKPGNVML